MLCFQVLSYYNELSYSNDNASNYFSKSFKYIMDYLKAIYGIFMYLCILGYHFYAFYLGYYFYVFYEIFLRFLYV